MKENEILKQTHAPDTGHEATSFVVLKPYFFVICHQLEPWIICRLDCFRISLHNAFESWCISTLKYTVGALTWPHLAEGSFVALSNNINRRLIFDCHPIGSGVFGHAEWQLRLISSHYRCTCTTQHINALHLCNWNLMKIRI